jgi:hypothetical protein
MSDHIILVVAEGQRILSEKGYKVWMILVSLGGWDTVSRR